MSDNWDDDDYDPNAQLEQQAGDKLATLGLDEVIRQQQKPAGPSQNQNDETTLTSMTNKQNNAKTNTGTNRKLTEQEKREAQLRSDAAAAMDLFGIPVERKEQTFDDLQTKSDFQAFAEKFGEQIAARHAHPHYLLFVNSLIDHITKPMTKIQLQTVQETVKVHLDVHVKRENEQQKQKQEQQNKKQKQKAKKQQVREDLVEDEYDDLDEKATRDYY